jgi:hypothetical protein
MSIWNGYCTLEEFKRSLTASNQTLDTDNTDDMTIEDMIERSSRDFDGLMGRMFYPRIETRYFDLPEDDCLYFDDDLLAVLSLANGDGVAIAPTEYKFLPINDYPKYALKLTDVTGTIWSESSTGSEDQVITLNGIWGYREQYSIHAWTTGSILNETGNLNATDTTFTVDSSSKFGTDQIIKIENELMIVKIISGDNITVIQRGDNGSTAATHADNTIVSIWNHPADLSKFILAMALIDYKSRFQPQTVETTTYMSPAGIVSTPRSLPVNAKDIINHYKRRV